MGLDMYLKRKRKSDKRTIEEICNLGYNEYVNALENIAYWRKANQVHKWFVDNVQSGNDDCDFYEVTKEKIQELVTICDEILRVIEVDSDGVIKNPEICKRLLPTQDGFFFGTTEYNQWYVEDIRYTRDRLQAILDLVEFDLYDIYYGSSW